MEILYEHHTAIKKDKLCPFKLGSSKNSLPAPANWHENIEIIWATGGEGAVQYGKDTLPFLVGDICVVNSGVLHRPYSTNGLSYYFMIIDERFCKENGLDITAVRFSRLFRDEKTEALYLTAAEAIAAYAKDPSPLLALRLRHCVLSLLIDLFERHTEEKEERMAPPSLSEQYVKKAMGYINEHFSEHITLEALAALCGVHKCHLSREFKRITGQTVFEYINALRCSKAENLLFEGKSATEAALESGFESLSYFSRTYKRFMGESPSKRCGQK